MTAKRPMYLTRDARRLYDRQRRALPQQPRQPRRPGLWRWLAFCPVAGLGLAWVAWIIKHF